MNKGEVLVPTSKIKQETPDEDMKEYAETAMNELLGWYGYGIVPKKLPCHSRSGSNSSGPDSPKYTDVCDWCGKPAEDSKRLAAAGTNYCSELCFSQSRRANFKRNKTCDWCRHVRHTVSYVDFQDGASQLQFCSDKCLNQYKMQLFCRETQAHLQLHPHREETTSTTALITPDLWMRNCKSPNCSTSPPPPQNLLDKDEPQTSPLPLVARHSNRDSPEVATKRRSRIFKKGPGSSALSRKRCPSTITSQGLSADAPQDLRVRCTPPVHEDDNKEAEKEEGNKKEPCTSTSNSTNGPSNLNAYPPLSQISPLSSLLPPVTVFVPHPIIIPLPLPIPIPIFLPFKGTVEDSIKASHVENGISKKTETEADADETKDEKLPTGIDENLNEEKRVVGRPLRKRKRIAVETKTKVGAVKSKKFLSV